MTDFSRVDMAATIFQARSASSDRQVASMRSAERTKQNTDADLKAASEHLHLALTGVSNRRTLENLCRASQYALRHGAQPVGVGARPLVVVSTLLVPGYVDTEEVRQLARFISEVDPDIPYALLGFHPHFYVPDLPRTSVRHAEEAEAAARGAGLNRVRVGNRHLLSRAY